jgi:hypothetical protein
MIVAPLFGVSMAGCLDIPKDQQDVAANLRRPRFASDERNYASIVLSA